ncbi:hypothetical protein [Streptomyces barringtoniae]|uniref:hypothetical protein n=1 Tax=Streptomyces barringtoniae TaxID=2892029 RepID=UPI001E63FC1C|nr:hypothetical protein [Streptomyces barringtoniae]MCC5480967.1 hypothetical protein [Streptomyces barringtoniae]
MASPPRHGRVHGPAIGAFVFGHYGDRLGPKKLLCRRDADAPVGTSPTSSCPNPPAASTWYAGCWALKLSYDATTGNVSEIDFVTSGGSTLPQTPVADYTYDAAGRRLGALPGQGRSRQASWSGC